MRSNESHTAVSELAGIASPRPGQGLTLLWVDDSESLLTLYEAIFGRLGFEVRVVRSPHEALDQLALHAVDVVILDYEMPRMNGCVLAALIKRRHPELPVILYSGSLCVPQSARRWVDAICPKTAPREHLLALIEATLTQRNISPCNKHAADKYGEQVDEPDAPRRAADTREPRHDSAGTLKHELRIRFTAQRS